MPDIIAVIARLDFVFAKTMPELPHEYTIRRKARSDDDYVALYDAIMTDGVVEYWGKDGKRFYPARYLYPGDGWRYWSMSAWRSDAEGRHPLEISRHINRSLVEEGDKLRAAGLLLSEPPPAPAPRPPIGKPGEVRYTQAFTRTFRQLLGPHGYKEAASPRPELVVFAKDATVIEITNPSQPGGSKLAMFTITRNGGKSTAGSGRDALADELGVPRFRR